ncbi:MAG TPA: hypothetical protein VGO47_09130, partial [Chlamydiales bacterium]|nr:hypothetical protein [Chlamydiales bacterium]
EASQRGRRSPSISPRYLACYAWYAAIVMKHSSFFLCRIELGHWILFKAGWLHRDVSFGNILLMTSPMHRQFQNE